MRKLKNWRLIKFEKERVSSQWDSPPPWKRETSAPASNFALRRRRCKKETRGDLATVQPEKDFCFIGADIHSRCFFPFFFFFICLAAPERRKLRHQRHLATGAVSRPVPQHHLPDWRVSTQCVSLNQVRFSFFNKFSNDLSKYLFKFQFFQIHSLDIFIEIRS